ncbi:MAG: FIG007785: exported protein, partial [uncultured Sphingomonas sp.]
AADRHHRRGQDPPLHRGGGAHARGTGARADEPPVGGSGCGHDLSKEPAKPGELLDEEHAGAAGHHLRARRRHDRQHRGEHGTAEPRAGPEHRAGRGRAGAGRRAFGGAGHPRRRPGELAAV